MKLNMKRVALGLCMAACLFSLSACSKADTASSEIDVNIQAQLSQMASGYLSSYVNIPDDQLDEVRSQTAKQSEALAEGVDSWKNVRWTSVSRPTGKVRLPAFPLSRSIR